MKRSVFKLIFLFSLVFNVVCMVYLLTPATEKDPVLKDVRLSNDQKETIERKTHDIIESNCELTKKLTIHRQELYNLLIQDNPDREKIAKWIKQINRLQHKIQQNTIDHLLLYKKHLSKTQCDCLMRNVAVKMGVEQKCGTDCECVE